MCALTGQSLLVKSVKSYTFAAVHKNIAVMFLILTLSNYFRTIAPL